MRINPLLLALVAGSLLLAGPGKITAQSPAPPTTVTTQFTPQSLADLKTLNALIAEIQAQQKTMADNQAQIDQKLAALAETIRTARIYAKRGGGGGN